MSEQEPHQCQQCGNPATTCIDGVEWYCRWCMSIIEARVKWREGDMPAQGDGTESTSTAFYPEIEVQW
jgi:ribosomal protein L37AE/L43A